MKFKKFLSMVLAAAMALSLAVPASAAKPAKNTQPAVSSEKTITLKGEQTGTEFDYAKECWSTWQNVVFLGGANENSTDEEVSAWHLVYTDKKGIDNDLKSMKLTFDNSEVYEWNWNIGLSTNGSGKNPGWMVVAPAGWGRIDVDQSFVVTTSSKNVQFNISGYYEAGSKPVEPDEPVDPDDGKVSAEFQITKYLNEYGAPGAGFVFDIISVETNEIVGTMTSDADGEAKTELSVAPGKYIIREQVDANEYMPVSDIVVIVDENGNATFDDTAFDGTITNVQWGKLEYTKPEVTEEYTEIWHELAYDKFTSVETLVSATGCTPGGKDYTCTENHGVLPDCVVEHGAHTNGFTWLKFDKTQLQTETKGVNIGISDKNRDIPDVAPENPWEEPVAPYYNVRIVGNDLVVTSNLKNFVARVYNLQADIEFNPKAHSGDNKQITVPLTNIGDQFYLFLHVANKDGYEYKDATTAYHTGGTVERECERPYAGTVIVTVTDEAGKTITDLDKMAPGEYTVTVTANGQTLDTRTVTVKPGETTTVTFPDNLTVQGSDEYWCAKENCENHTKHDQNYYVPATPVEP